MISGPGLRDVARRVRLTTCFKAVLFYARFYSLVKSFALASTLLITFSKCESFKMVQDEQAVGWAQVQLQLPYYGIGRCRLM